MIFIWKFIFCETYKYSKFEVMFSLKNEFLKTRRFFLKFVIKIDLEVSDND